MNPLIRAQIEHHRALRQAVVHAEDCPAREDRQPTQDELGFIARSNAELERLRTVIGEDLEDAGRADDVTALAARVAANGDAVRMAGSAAPVGQLGLDQRMPNLMPSPTQVAEMHRAVATHTSGEWVVEGDTAPIQHRAAVTTAGTGVGLATVPAPALREPRRIATAVQVPVEMVQGIEGLAYPTFGDGVANITAEGAAKQEYSAITPGSATPQMIAVWTDYSRQVQLSMPAFESRLRAKHAALVAKREDQLMVARLNGVTGAQTYVGTGTPAYGDSLLAASGLVLASDVAAAPDIVLVNPADLPKIFPAATTQGVNGTTPDSAMRLEIHGMLVYPTVHVTAGNAIVAALAASTRVVVGLRPTVVVDALSGLKTNTITSLMEEAVTLAIEEPTGVVLVDLIP